MTRAWRQSTNIPRQLLCSSPLNPADVSSDGSLFPSCLFVSLCLPQPTGSQGKCVSPLSHSGHFMPHQPQVRQPKGMLERHSLLGDSELPEAHLGNTEFYEKFEKLVPRKRCAHDKSKVVQNTSFCDLNRQGHISLVRRRLGAWDPLWWDFLIPLQILSSFFQAAQRSGCSFPPKGSGIHRFR